jgi:selenocysteine lyase/cysteine desulfurase
MKTPSFDVSAVRRQFPVMQRMLYLDSAHQTPLAGSVREALFSFYSEGHEYGGPKPVWLRRVEQVRQRVGEFFNADASEIAFTKNTSEGLNIAANAVPLQPGDNVLLIAGDHPNNAYAWLNLRRKGVEVRFIDLKTDVADASTFEKHIDGRTRVITLSHVSFHAGQRHDLESIGRLCQDRGIYLVVDAMQSVGVVPIDVKKMGISVLSAGCHKGMLVPQGVGVLYVRKGLDELQPAYLAMTSMANPPPDYIARPEDMATRSDAVRFETGNLNLPDIHALNAALDLITSVGVERIEEHVLGLGDRLIELMDELDVRIVGPRNRRDRAHIYVLDLPVTEWLDYFAQSQVRVSPERDGIRVSFGMFNTITDVEQLAQIMRRQRSGQPARGVAQID